MSTGRTITVHETAQVECANASRAIPVVFVHGLRLLPSSWDRWVTLFEKAGSVGARVCQAVHRTRTAGHVNRSQPCGFVKHPLTPLPMVRL